MIADMHDSRARNAEKNLEDVLPAGTRAININALTVDSKDREYNG